MNLIEWIEAVATFLCHYKQCQQVKEMRKCTCCCGEKLHVFVELFAVLINSTNLHFHWFTPLDLVKLGSISVAILMPI